METRKALSEISNKPKRKSLSIKKATPEIGEGPYYKPNSPERAHLLETGVLGERLILSGHVLDTMGKPISHVWLDFWQADGKGNYDISGYRLRGHQFTDKSGNYFLETVVPGSYAIRTPHIHVKVQSKKGSPVLSTQLFFPGLASNKADFLFLEETQMDIKETPEGKLASFDFVLASK